MCVCVCVCSQRESQSCLGYQCPVSSLFLVVLMPVVTQSLFYICTYIYMYKINEINCRLQYLEH